MFLPRLAFSGVPWNVGELVNVFLAGPRPASSDAVGPWACGYGPLLQMLLDWLMCLKFRQRPSLRDRPAKS